MLVKIKILFAGLYLAGLFSSACFVSEEKSKAEVKTEDTSSVELPEKKIVVGAERMDAYLPKLLEGQIALVVNHTSRLGEAHLVDTLLSSGVRIARIFAPEHGFRGDADAGEQIADGKDISTGIMVVSLYGNKKKPSAQDLQDISLLVFDIQDVGARFYTYISTMHYVMESCAENGIKMLILDRPNPNGHYVDGPVLEKGFESFVGMHPVPVVHGMTIAEYARMINGEGWLSNGLQCPLDFVLCENYDHKTVYNLPVKPSPNLPNMRAIYLYPSLCFFEGTDVSVGRGTNKQFQVYGHPVATFGDYQFTPTPMPGASHPPHSGKKCTGFDLSELSEKEIRQHASLNLDYLSQFYNEFPEKDEFFLKNNFFNKLAGNASLQAQIKDGKSMQELRESWEPGLKEFREMRAKYLFYKDFD